MKKIIIILSLGLIVGNTFAQKVVAHNDTITVLQNQSVGVEVLLNDEGSPFDDPEIFSSPFHGNAYYDGQGYITYSTGFNYSGLDSFTYRVCKTGSNNCDVGTVIVNILPDTNDYCNASFSFSKINNNPFSFTFYNFSDGNFDNLTHWDFGDNTSSSEFDPNHTYTGEGTYVVTLTIGNDTTLCTDTYTQEIKVNSNRCNADFYYYQKRDSSYTVYFQSGFGSNFPNDTMAKYSWNFGDNSSPSTEKFPDHTYANKGKYNVCLIVISDNKDTCKICKIIDVQLYTTSTECFTSFEIREAYEFDTISGNKCKLADIILRGSYETDSIYINFGDGTDTTLFEDEYFIRHAFPLFNKNYKVSIKEYFNNFICTASENIKFDKLPLYLQTSVFFDINSNGIQDFNPKYEDNIANRKVIIKSLKTSEENVYYVDRFTDYVLLSIDTGKYEIRTELPKGWLSTTPTKYTFYYKSFCGGNKLGEYRFGQKADETVNDLAITTTAITAFRPGFNAIYNIEPKNIGGLTKSGTVIFNYDNEKLQYLYSEPQASSHNINNGQLVWNFSNLKPSEYNRLRPRFRVMAPPVANFGDTLCSNSQITPLQDNIPSNNIYDECILITGAYDPNDKSVSPQGTINNGTKLTYTIRFQNTGSDTAFFVNISDQISEWLDLNTLEILSSSHDVGIGYGEIKDEINFRFYGILLPDSFVDEVASHGYVKYSIMPKPNLTVGTQIENTANIFFDYNDAITTNTTLNIIGKVNSINVKNANIMATVIPNPFNEYAKIVFNNINKEKLSIKIIDIHGKTLRTYNNIVGNECQVNKEELPAGLYFYSIENANNALNRGTLNIQ